MQPRISTVIAICLLLCGCNAEEFGETRQALGAGAIRRVANAVPGQYVVVLRDSVPGMEVPARATALAAAHGGTLGLVYQHALKGFSIKISEAGAMALLRNPRVDYVIEDGRVEVSDDAPGQYSSAPVGSLWGLDR